MLTLPPALAPWGAELGLFPPEVALGLGGLVLRLSAAIGALHVSRSDARDDPDGFHGLARRGPYERLVMSEWLLADQLPDEFLRRAAAGEHTFLELAHLTPVAGRTSIALFDAGPTQLGSPRVAHVALLVVLARRAMTAGAAFTWGVIQSGGSTVFEGVTPESVLHLLGAKTTRSVDGAMIEDWRARIDEVGPSPSRDLWVVGGVRAREAAVAVGGASVLVEDVVEPGTRSVSVDVRRGAGPARQVVLDLPDGRLVARILRAPFEVTTAAKPKASPSEAPASRLLIGATGGVAFARSGHDVLGFPIANSARAPVGNARVIKSSGPIAAINQHRGGRIYVAANHVTRALTLWFKGSGRPIGHYTTEAKVHAPWEPRVTDPLQPILVRSSGTTPTVLYVDSRGWLFQLDDGERARPRLLARGVLATASARGVVAFVAREVTGTWFRDPPHGPVLGELFENGEHRLEALRGSDIVAARLGYDGEYAHRALLSAIRRGDTWFVNLRRDRFEEVVDENARVVGAVVRGGQLGPALLALEPDRRSLTLVRDGVAEILTQAASDVIEAAIDDRGRVVGLLTEGGELSFYSIGRREIVGSFRVGGTP